MLHSKLRVNQWTVGLAKELFPFTPTMEKVNSRYLKGGYASKFTSGHPGDPVFADKANLALRKGLDKAAEQIKELVEVPISQNQFDALVLLVYEIGVKRFRRSSILNHLNDQQPLWAATKFHAWTVDRTPEWKDGKSVVTRRDSLVLKRRREQMSRIFCGFPLL